MGFILKTYLSQKTQYIASNNDIEYLRDIYCSVPQECILGLLLFWMYLNDVYLASKLKNVMSSDETNLFISDENIGKQLKQQ